MKMPVLQFMLMKFMKFYIQKSNAELCISNTAHRGKHWNDALIIENCLLGTQ